MQLNEGSFNSKEVISSEQINLSHSVFQSILPGNGMYVSFPMFFEAGVGLGWFVAPYRGHKVVFHNGELDGITNVVFLLPDDNIGFSILSNMQSTFQPFVLSFYIIDLLLGLPPQVPDWNAFYGNIANNINKQNDEALQQRNSNRVPNTIPSHPMGAYAGNYSNVIYGYMIIEDDLTSPGNLTMVYHIFGTDPISLLHWHFDVFLLADNWFVVFQTDQETGKIISLGVNFEPTITEDIIFDKN